MIKKIVGVLVALAAIGVIVWAVWNNRNYVSMVFDQPATNTLVAQDSVVMVPAVRVDSLPVADTMHRVAPIEPLSKE
ncbi:MAG: hypothetical protein RR330_02360 [Alistipes sp.]